MKPLKLFGALLPILLGLAAAAWTPLSFLSEMKEGLIAFLGFLAASLMQVMPLTANFLQSDKLSVIDAKRLSKSLTKQQNYWMGMLCVTVLALVILIVGAALEKPLASLPPIFDGGKIPQVSWTAVATFFIATTISFVLVKMIGLLKGIRSLHQLRAELVIDAAKKESTQKTESILKNEGLGRLDLSEDYGEVILPQTTDHK